ncbi:MAG: hypothetical protein WCD75_04505 [Rhodoplanes sp.]
MFCDDIEMPFRVLPPLVELITKDRGGDDECAADEVAAFQTNRPLKLLLHPNPLQRDLPDNTSTPLEQWRDGGSWDIAGNSTKSTLMASALGYSAPERTRRVGGVLLDEGSLN